MSKSALNITEDEQRLRHEIAAVTLLLNRQGLLGYSGHVSGRIPGQERFLIQSIHQSRAALRPEQLLLCDLDGRAVDAPEGERPPSEVFIHTEIYKARPDVQAIAHFHHDLTTTFSIVEGVRLQPIKNHAIRWKSGIPVHPDPSHVNSPALGQALAKSLGPHHGLIIRAHGEVIVAESLPELLMDCIHFVENAEALYHAKVLGPVIPLTSEEIEAFSRHFERKKHASKLWIYYVGLGRDSGAVPEAWTSHLEHGQKDAYKAKKPG